jgi:hypothetical protein
LFDEAFAESFNFDVLGPFELNKLKLLGQRTNIDASLAARIAEGLGFTGRSTRCRCQTDTVGPTFVAAAEYLGEICPDA